MEIVIDEFRYLTGAYYGMKEMDEYDLKEYILKDIENYIKDFINTNKIKDFNYKKEAERVEEERTLITKLQDLLLVLPKINAPMELTLLVKKRIKKLKEENR